MSTTTVLGAASVADRVYGLIQSDSEADAIFNEAHGIEWGDERGLTLIDWGTVYGMCFAIVHASDPWVTARTAAPVAAQAARLVMDEWASSDWRTPTAWVPGEAT